MGHADPTLQGSALSRTERCLWPLLPLGGLLAVFALLARGPLPLEFGIAWLPALGIGLNFHIDGLSALMLLLITGIGTAVFVYVGEYLAGHPQQRRLYGLLTAFALAMIGCVTADDLIVLFMCWELTSLLSFLLVGFNHQDADSRKAAQQAFLVTGAGGLVLLAGFVLLAQLMGSWQISEIVPRLAEMPATPAFVAAITLIVVGACTKSAQYPFHFWLPNAMSAPTPVSAYLHSATMVKLGVFLLARLDAGMTGWSAWQIGLQTVGSLTAAWGMLLALRERDLKRILAWSTVATLGTLVTLIGVPGADAAAAVAILLLAHGLYKATLFFIAGNVDYATGTRIIDNLGRLRRAMPWTATAALFGALSMAGVPSTFGFVAKNLLLAAKDNAGVLVLAGVANTLFSAVAVAVAAVAAIRVFWERRGTVRPEVVREGRPALYGPPLLLGGLGMLLGFFPELAEPVVNGAMQAIAPGVPPPLDLDLELLNVVAVLGTVAFTLGAGALVYLFWEPLHHLFGRLLGHLPRVGLSANYRRALHGLPQLAAGLTRRTQHGRLPGYGVLLFGAVTAALLLAVWGAGVAGVVDAPWPAWSAPPAGTLVGGLLVAGGAALMLVLRHRLALVLATSLIGYGCAALFLYAGAADVAFTQFVVETVLVIVLASTLMLLRRSGRGRLLRAEGARAGHLALAAGFAAVIVLVWLGVVGQPFDSSLSEFFARESVPAAHGRNVVNVILVDFRALDTFGEISVVLLALLAALPLFAVARRARRAEGGRMNEHKHKQDSRLLMLEVASRPLYVLMLCASLAVLLRGHNEPGGGFIAGLLAASASVLWAVVYSPAAATRRLPLGAPARLGALGVVVAAAAGGPALLLGQPFLHHLWWGPLSTVLLFDLGVYLCVWGGIAGFALHLLALDDAGAGASDEAREEGP